MRLKQSARFVVRLSTLALACQLFSYTANAIPKTVVISLDGATPRIVQRYLATGILSRNEGIGLLATRGFYALQNQTIAPSLTAPGHIAIATGSTGTRNDIPANTFHLVASPFTANISGFGAPIGGYSIDGPAPSPDPTAEPLWVQLRAAGKKVVTATFPGGDGVDVRVPGLMNSPIIQSAAVRTVEYTIPFGAFAGQGAMGFTLVASDFDAAQLTTIVQLAAAGRVSFSPVREKRTPLESFLLGGVSYELRLAALDTTDDNKVNYDMLVVFDSRQGIQPGPFSLPSTGPAYIKNDGRSAPFYFEGSSSRAGAGFFVSFLAPNLSIVRLTRYSANSIPRNPAVLSDIDDVNNNVGFWAPQPDFRIVERLSPGFDNFPDIELEAMYLDQVETFTDYQTRLALHAIARNPDADLVMIYFEQPDGSSHQFLLIDPRQPTRPNDPISLGFRSDPAKVARYAGYVARAYQAADRGVQRILEAIGFDEFRVPLADVFVVSDHGFDPFHTAVSMNNLLQQAGIPSTMARAITSGPAVNVYINLRGREPDGTVTPQEYVTLQRRIAELLRNFLDTNPIYTRGEDQVPVFDKVYLRPVPNDPTDPTFGRATNENIGQDFGDVFAMLSTGYNFDGVQSPVIYRLSDPISSTPVLSVPNFYGAHGYEPNIPNMSAIFIAAGPHIGRGLLPSARNIDVAPTVMKILGVPPAPTVEGTALPILREPR
jgi:predicted AlkP superfamily pyrophosphatase or phosphodiesterase